MNCEICKGRGWTLRACDDDLLVARCRCDAFPTVAEAHRAAQDALAAWSDSRAVVRRILTECSRDTIRAVVGALEHALTMDKLEALEGLEQDESEPDDVPTDEDWEAYDRSPDEDFRGVTNGPVRVQFIDLNEGDNGDFNPNDPDDTPLLRLDIQHKVDGEWEPVDNGSYCTRVPRSTPQDVRMKLLRLAEEAVHLPVTMGTSIKHVCGRLSGMEPEWAESGLPQDIRS